MILWFRSALLFMLIEQSERSGSIGSLFMIFRSFYVFPYGLYLVQQIL